MDKLPARILFYYIPKKVLMSVLIPILLFSVVVVINMWIGIPYTMMTFSGVLMNIPAELYESAEIDGAGVLQSFFSITLPYMIFVTAPATITTFVGNINNFNVIYLLTGGGPLHWITTRLERQTFWLPGCTS